MMLGPQAWKKAPETGDHKTGDSNHPLPSELSRDLTALFLQLNTRGVQYVLVGGVALLKYIQGRNTDDVDLILAAEALEKLPELVIEDRNPDTARGRFGSLRVDLLFTTNPVFGLVEQRFKTTHRFAETSVSCVTVEGLVLLKLYALPALYRTGDLQRAALYETDITMLMQQHNPDVASILPVLRPYLSAGEFEELQRIASELQQRRDRMERRSGGKT